MSFDPDVRARLELDAKEIISRYPRSRSALLPLLHLVQAEEGFVSPAGIELCAELLEISTAEVAGVVTFYTMYKRRPNGEYSVGVCTNTLCAVMGGDQVFAELKAHLGVGHDETTADGKVTLEHIECNAACDYAPVVMVNWEFFDNQTPESATALVDDLRAGRAVQPTRGPRLCTFKEVSRVLAGFPDGLAHDGPAAGPPTLLGLELFRAEERSSAPAGKPATKAAARKTATKKATKKSTTKRATKRATSTEKSTETSAHDAPSMTAESDPSHGAAPGTEETGE